MSIGGEKFFKNCGKLIRNLVQFGIRNSEFVIVVSAYADELKKTLI